MDNINLNNLSLQEEEETVETFNNRKLREFGLESEQWHDLLLSEHDKDELKLVLNEIDSKYRSRTLSSSNPDKGSIFGFTHHHSTGELLPENVRVVIVGQDPSQSNKGAGYAFGTKNGPSPSLINIFDCVTKDVGGDLLEPTGLLDGWIAQGVLLINACPLYIRKGDFQDRLTKVTQAFITGLVKKNPDIFFILMGSVAEATCNMDVNAENVVVTCHPAWKEYNKERPAEFEEKFYDKKPFSKANAWLAKTNRGPAINWLSFK